MPATSKVRIETMAVSMGWVVFKAGSRNACTPLLTASTPVNAVQPLEKALSKSQALTTAVCGGSGGGGTTRARAPPAANEFASPNPKNVDRGSTQRKVGPRDNMPGLPT